MTLGATTLNARVRTGLCLVLVALAVKAIALFQLHDHLLLQPEGSPDSEAYVALAHRVAGGDVALGPGAYFVSPLYIYFLAAFIKLSGSLLLARISQLILGTAAVWLIWWTTHQWFSGRAAVIAGVLGIGTGLLTFYEVSLLQASLDPFLTALAVAGLTAALKKDGVPWFVATGGAFGLAVLNRPNMILVMAAVIVTLFVLRRWKAAAALSVGTVLVLFPLGVRNVVVSGEWSMLPSHGGLNLHIGNAPDATGLYRAVPGIRGTILGGQAVDMKRVAEGARGRTLTDGEVSGYFAGLAWQWMAEAPGDAVRLFGKKVFYTLHAQHIALPLSFPFFAHDAASVLQWLVVGPWFLVTVGAFGLVVGPRVYQIAWREYAPWLVIAPAMIGSVALFFAAERYRLPLMVPLVIGAGAALDTFVIWVNRRAWGAIGAGVVAITLGLSLLNAPLGLQDADGRREERLKMAEAVARQGDLAQARRWVAAAMDVYPYPEAAHMRMAVALVDGGLPDEAAAHLRQLGALPAPNAVADFWLRAGRLAAQVRAVDTAVTLFGHAVQVTPSDVAAHDQLAIALMLAGRLDEAEKEFEWVVTRQPDNADAWAHRAYIAAQQGAIEDARSYADRALRIQPGHGLASQVLKAIST